MTKDSKTIKIIFVTLTLLSLLSCASTKFDGSAVLSGRVSDPQGNPVPNYHLSNGFGSEAISNENGVFFIRNVKAASYEINGYGRLWQSFKCKYDFFDRKTLLCIEVEPLENILDEIEPCLEKRNFSQAKKILSKSKKSNEEEPLYICMENLISYCEKNSEKNQKRFYESLEKVQKKEKEDKKI